jgi:hypothetical protein
MSTHPTSDLISRYATGAAGVDDASVWAVEAHLESCAACRALLAGALDPDTRTVLDRAADGIAAGIQAGPAPGRRRRRRWRRTGVAARLLPSLGTAAGLMLTAVLFEKVFDIVPSLVLLLAPVAPLLPVAAAWSRSTDPAWELMASVPRAGLRLLLQRTFAVLAAVVPILAVAGWGTGHSPAQWLLPGLAFVAGTLALGGLVGVDRAALALTIIWSAGVVLPSLIGDRLPAILTGGTWPGWAAVTVALAAVVLVRAADHRRLGAGRD